MILLIHVVAPNHPSILGMDEWIHPTENYGVQLFIYVLVHGVIKRDRRFMQTCFKFWCVVIWNLVSP